MKWKTYFFERLKKVTKDLRLLVKKIILGAVYFSNNFLYTFLVAISTALFVMALGDDGGFEIDLSLLLGFIAALAALGFFWLAIENHYKLFQGRSKIIVGLCVLYLDVIFLFAVAYFWMHFLAKGRCVFNGMTAIWAPNKCDVGSEFLTANVPFCGDRCIPL